MAEKQPETPTKPKVKLVVVESFDDYRRGDSITDPKEVQRVLQNHAHHVVKAGA